MVKTLAFVRLPRARRLPKTAREEVCNPLHFNKLAKLFDRDARPTTRVHNPGIGVASTGRRSPTVPNGAERTPGPTPMAGDAANGVMDGEHSHERRANPR